MKGILVPLFIALLVISTVDYIVPLNVPLITENNPFRYFEQEIYTPFESGMAENSNVIDLDEYNLDFEYGVIGWHTHNLYSVPVDYFDSTFDDAKSGLQSLRVAHSCSSLDSDSDRPEITEKCLFRSDKLPAFEKNVYVKFYIKSLRKHENSWWPNDFGYEYASQTTYSLNVEAIDEWGERIYQKDIISEMFNKQNSQLTKIIAYDYSNNASAEDYFKKINAIDYNATQHGSLDQIQAMIDMQNSFVQGEVLYYVTNVNSLPSSSYAVYLGDGWYTVIMPIPKETRYLGFTSQVYCAGQNEGWIYSAFGDVFAPSAPGTADTLTYIDGITFINTVTSADVTAPTITNSNTVTPSDNDWTSDVNADNGGNTVGKTKIWGFLLFVFLLIAVLFLGSPKNRQKGFLFLKKNKIIPRAATKTFKPVAKAVPVRREKKILVHEHYRKEKSGGGIL